MGWIWNEPLIFAVGQQIQQFQNDLTNQNFSANDEGFNRSLPTFTFDNNGFCNSNFLLISVGILSNLSPSNSQAELRDNQRRNH